MKSSIWLLAAGVLSLVTSAGVTAQTTSTYAPSDETIFVEAINPHLMYWVVDADTLGTPVESVTLETQRWTRSGPHLEVIVRQEALLPQRSVEIDTFSIEPTGRVLSINGHAPAMHGRVDFLPRLPAGKLELGTRWSDTLRTVTEGPAGEHVYGISRQYRVTRMLDTLGAKVVEIEAEGEVRYRDGWWADSTQTARAWLDVKGPVTERFGFDPSRGQVVYRRWWMNLQGEGSIPDGKGGSRSVSAGLLSGSRARIITQAESEALRESPEQALKPAS